MININNTVNSDGTDDEIYSGHYHEGVFFTKGRVSIYHFNEFAKFGINGLRILQYIRTKQGLIPRSNPLSNRFNTWIYVDNKNLYEWFGVHQSTKWELLKKMKKANLIDYIPRGSGHLPRVRIVLPEKNLN